MHDAKLWEALTEEQKTRPPLPRKEYPGPDNINSTCQYDYDNQAWIVDGLYVDCGHRIRTHGGIMACMTRIRPDSQIWRESPLCFGRVHQGERAPSIH